MRSETKTHILPEKFSFDEDTALKVFLRDNRTSAIAVSARHLRRVDSLLVQYLMTAAHAWKQAGLDFTLIDVSPDLDNALRLLGIDEKTLCWKVAA